MSAWEIGRTAGGTSNVPAPVQYAALKGAQGTVFATSWDSNFWATDRHVVKAELKAPDHKAFKETTTVDDIPLGVDFDTRATDLLAAWNGGVPAAEAAAMKVATFVKGPASMTYAFSEVPNGSFKVALYDAKLGGSLVLGGTIATAPKPVLDLLKSSGYRTGDPTKVS